MTSLASEGRAIGSHQPHPFHELTFMRIGVAAFTVQIFPVIDGRGFRFELRRLLVTIRAGHCNVTTCEYKSRLLMVRQSKSGWSVAFEVMTAVTGVEVRGGRKLSGMAIAVAIGAAVKFDFVQRVLPFRDVALRALEPRVAALQRILRGCMVLYGEFRRFPCVNRVTRAALSGISALHELAVVRILVAVHALGED